MIASAIALLSWGFLACIGWIVTSMAVQWTRAKLSQRKSCQTIEEMTRVLSEMNAIAEAKTKDRDA